MPYGAEDPLGPAGPRVNGPPNVGTKHRPGLWMTTMLVPVQLAIPSSWSSASRNNSRDMPGAQPREDSGGLVVYRQVFTGVYTGDVSTTWLNGPRSCEAQYFQV